MQSVHLSAPIALSHKHAHIYCILSSERGVLLGNQRRRAADSCKTHTRPAGFSRLWTLRCGRGGARWLLGRVALAAAANSLGRWDARPSGPPKAILSRAPRRRLKIAAPQLPPIGYCPAACVFAERANDVIETFGLDTQLFSTEWTSYPETFGFCDSRGFRRSLRNGWKGD
jgi:hypothetical protein